MSPDMQKYEIVNALIARNSYGRYLEICTPSTGFRFSRIDRTHLHWCHRLMYRCPPGFTDGSEITFRSGDEHIGHLLDPALPYDLIFLDPHHTFECSMRDLQSALAMLRPQGAIVVHDCSPTTKELAGPTFRSGPWFGVTYCAYLDFLLSHPDLVYYTVDADYGCGVITKASRDQVSASRHSELGRLWRLQRNQQQDMFDFFHHHRRELLNLISVRDFLSHEKVSLSGFSRLTRWRDNLASLLQT
jgi:hypothetical protein